MLVADPARDGIVEHGAERPRELCGARHPVGAGHDRAPGGFPFRVPLPVLSSPIHRPTPTLTPPFTAHHTAPATTRSTRNGSILKIVLAEPSRSPTGSPMAFPTVMA